MAKARWAQECDRTHKLKEKGKLIKGETQVRS